MTGPEWMPGAARRPRTGGAMEGQPWRSVVFHTSESGNDAGAIGGVADWVIRQGSEYHLLWNPWHDQFLQLIKASQSARALRNAAGGYRTNRKGTRLIQVCIVGRTADRPLAGGSPLKGRDRLVAWLDSQGVPRTDRTGSRDRRLWESSGVHRHADAPGNDHTDPGPVDLALLYGGAPAPGPEPSAPTAAPPDEEEYDMWMIARKRSNGEAWMLCGSTARYGIYNADAIKQAVDRGIPLLDLDDKTFAALVKGRATHTG